MIPVKVKWFRNCARARLCNAWIIVKCCLHREAPQPFRIKYAKAAGWLEATVEFMTSHNESPVQLECHNEKTEAIIKMYRQLQDEVEACARRQNVKEDIENIKIKFVDLLDLCGIKDADIPLFDEPNSVRHNRQSLITSFGIMSKKSPHTTPRRNRPVRCDPSNYADMLIEQLLAQASSITDSDTSPPRAEDNSDQVITSMESEIQKNNNNEKVIPLDLHSLGPCPPHPSKIPSGLSSACTQNVDNKIDDQQNIASVATHSVQQCFKYRSSAFNGDRPTQSHNTTDSGMVGSDHSLAAAACTRENVHLTETTNFDFSPEKSRTSGSTPELPTSMSSTSLDIPFASLFDLMDCQSSPKNYPFEGDLAPELYPSDSRHLQNSPVQLKAHYFNFPVRYSRSYARQLDNIESEGAHSRRLSSAQEADSLLDHTHFRPTFTSWDHEKSEMVTSEHIGTHQPDFIFCEPLVVCLAPESVPNHSKHVFDRHDLKIDKKDKPHLGDKNADVVSDSDSERPPIPPRRPITDSKLGRFAVQSSSAEVGSTPKLAITPQSNETRSRLSQHSTYYDAAQCQYSCKKNQQAQYENSSSMSGISYDFSPTSVSWSYHHLPNAPQNSIISMSTGKSQHKETHRTVCDKFVTLRSRQTQSSPEANHSARDVSSSKRRKGNDKVAMPVSSHRERRSARQRLLFNSPTRYADEDSTSTDFPDVEDTLASFSSTQPLACAKNQIVNRKTGQSPALRRLKLQKENNSVSPCGFKSPRKPLTELYNIRVSDSNALAVSTNNFTTSESSETSTDLCLPSREEELLDRDAYYCDFTVDRQQKIDNFISRTTNAPSSNEENGNQHTLEDPAACEVLIRKVEGAESSPSSFVFRVPPSNLRAPRAVVRVQCQRLSKSKVVVSGRPGYQNVHRCTETDLPSEVRSVSSNSSSQGYPHFSSSNSSCDQNQPGTRSSSLSSRSSSKASRSSSRRSCTTHPIASSTLIMDSCSTSPDRETGGVYTRSVHEGLTPSDHEKTYVHGTSTKKSINNRPPIPLGKDSSNHLSNNRTHMGTSKITAMVSRFNESMTQSRQAESHDDITLSTSTGRSDVHNPVARRSINRNLSSRHILAAAKSFLKAMNSVSNSESHQCSENVSGQSSNHATTSSVGFNYARASIVCTSSEGSSMPEDGHLSYELSHSKYISASEPNLRCYYSGDDEEATSSLVPSDTDTTPERSVLQKRPDIPGRSSTSSSSSCTAARCRPRLVNRSCEKLAAAAALSKVSPLPLECSTSPDQELLDSILTDSPKSVNSSGIFAPHNSYNSPIESVGSHNGYSSTDSSSVSTENNYGIAVHELVAPPPTPHAQSVAENTTTFVAKSQSRTEKQSYNMDFKRPFTPVPHVVNHAAARPVTRNQGVTTNSTPSTPQRPMSVQSDPLSTKSVFTVPPGVITGPPKIKDKNSLVRKFKKFSSNFYKKTEKIQTLANL